MFLTYWLFNAYIFPKPEQKEVTSTESSVTKKEEKLNKPIISLTTDGIIMLSDSEDAIIRYNYEGREPSISDEIYTTPINENLENLGNLRAKVFVGEVASETAFYSENINLSEITQSSDLETVILENSLMKLVLSPRNGVITKAYLKEFAMGDDGNVQLIPANTSIGNVAIKNADLDNLIYFKEVDGNSVKFYLTDLEGNQTIAKEYSIGSDYSVAFNVYFSSQDYRKDYSIEFEGIADTENLNLLEQNPDKYFKSKIQDYKFFALDNNEIAKYPLSKLKKSSFNSQSDNTKWLAIRSKYFVMSLFTNNIDADKKFTASMKKRSSSFNLEIDDPEYGEEFSQEFTLYLGPVQQEYIESFDSTLIFDRVIERSWTWLHWLSKLFALAFKYLGKAIPNYGIVIIVFAILIKLLLYPLTHKSFENSIKMQKVQPFLTEIQKKYKSDPMKMQKEMSRVKKEHGVSTLGGCLPMLVQMPIFFSLYPALRYSIALRGATFFGWLQDLSSPDPYYVLPIIMGIFMFIQQKMMQSNQPTNQNLDEKQEAMMQSQKMMAYLMPVMMFFIFKSLPSGLVLYWTVFNILSIIQQHFINKKFRGQ